MGFYTAVEDILKKIIYNFKNHKRFDLLSELDYTVLDLETTGFNLPPLDRIIEIGAVRIKKMQIVDEFSTFVNPLKAIPPIVTEVTNIKNDDVRNAPKIGRALKEFFKFSANSIIVAYNVSFDFEFILEASKRSVGYVPKENTLCAFELSKRLLYFLDRYDLDFVCDYLNIKIENRHRALGDAKATAELFLILVNILKKVGINSFDEAKMLELSNTLPKEIRKLLEHYRRLGVI